MAEQHMHNEELTERIKVMGKQLKESETLKIQSTTELNSLRTQYRELESELESIGINPKEAEKEYEKLTNQINELMNDIQGQLTV